MKKVLNKSLAQANYETNFFATFLIKL